MDQTVSRVDPGAKRLTGQLERGEGPVASVGKGTGWGKGMRWCGGEWGWIEWGVCGAVNGVVDGDEEEVDDDEEGRRERQRSQDEIETAYECVMSPSSHQLTGHSVLSRGTNL
jgi:hypothetical protein